MKTRQRSGARAGSGCLPLNMLLCVSHLISLLTYLLKILFMSGKQFCEFEFQKLLLSIMPACRHAELPSAPQCSSAATRQHLSTWQKICSGQQMTARERDCGQLHPTNWSCAGRDCQRLEIALSASQKTSPLEQSAGTRHLSENTINLQETFKN